MGCGGGAGGRGGCGRASRTQDENWWASSWPAALPSAPLGGVFCEDAVVVTEAALLVIEDALLVTKDALLVTGLTGWGHSSGG